MNIYTYTHTLFIPILDTTDHSPGLFVICMFSLTLSLYCRGSARQIETSNDIAPKHQKTQPPNANFIKKRITLSSVFMRRYNVQGELSFFNQIRQKWLGTHTHTRHTTISGGDRTKHHNLILPISTCHFFHYNCASSFTYGASREVQLRRQAHGIMINKAPLVTARRRE